MNVPKASIARLLLVALAVMTTAIMAVFTFVEYANDSREYNEQLEQDLRTIPDQLAAGLSLPLWSFDLDQAGRLIEAAMTSRAVAAAAIRDQDGSKVLVARVRNERGEVVPAADTSGDCPSCLSSSRPIVYSGKQIGTIEVALTTKYRDQGLRENVTRLVSWILILNFALIFGVYWMLRRLVITPLTLIETFAAKVSRGETGSSVGGGSFAGELHGLRTSIETMVAELSRRMDEIAASKAALALAEERFRSIFERAQIGIFQSTWRGRFITANPAMAAIFGYDSPAALLASGDSVPRLYLEPAERNEVADILAAAGEIDNYHIHFRRADGKIRTGSLRARVEFGPDGKPAMLEGLMEDITPRIEIEEKLRLTQKHVKNILDSMPSVVIGVDLNGRITHFNKAAEADTGMTADNAVGQMVRDIYPALTGEMRRVAEAIESRQPIRRQKIARPNRGEVEYDDIMIYPLVANGAVGAVVRIDDVTERVRIEEMMIQSEKMMSLGGLAAGMAHEINNPLGAVLQGVQNALRRLDPNAPANAEAAKQAGLEQNALASYLEARRVRYFLEGVAEAGERAARIVAGMLEFSRRGAADPVMADMGGLVEKTIALAANDYDLKKLYDFRQIEIIRDFDPNLPPTPCVPTEIEQVLLNLLKNAAHALAMGAGAGDGQCAREMPATGGNLPSAGEIAERPEQADALGTAEQTHQAGETGPPAKHPCIRITTRKEGSTVRITVADNGPGMSEDVRRRVFEPFFTTKGMGIGTGLGLSVSYFIISQNHGGELSVDSAPGKGAAFTITLPLAKAAINHHRP